MRDKPRGLDRPRIADENRYRRRTDDCIAKRLYDAATPYVQIAGFVVLCAFTAGSNWRKVDGYDSRISALETEKAAVNQNIAALKQGQEDMAREVHIIYSALIGSQHASQ